MTERQKQVEYMRRLIQAYDALTEAARAIAVMWPNRECDPPDTPEGIKLRVEDDNIILYWRDGDKEIGFPAYLIESSEEEFLRAYRVQQNAVGR